MNITGHMVYRGMAAMQHVNIGTALKQLFTNKQPSQVLEIGTSHGGFVLMIRDLLNEVGLHNTYIRTYDIIYPKYLDMFINKGPGTEVEFIQKNLFENNYSKLKYKEEASEYIQRPGVTIVMCDGGCKKNEFNELSYLLKAGDIIMAHDYASDSEYFLNIIKDKIWNWHEIQDSDIRESCINNKLTPYMQDIFKDVVWVCKEKANE